MTSGRLQVVGEKWQVADGRLQVDGNKWQVKSNRWQGQVTDGSWHIYSIHICGHEGGLLNDKIIKNRENQKLLHLNSHNSE